MLAIKVSYSSKRSIINQYINLKNNNDKVKNPFFSDYITTLKTNKQH